jgi:NAD(P)H dehydrogenase (quinone)
MIRIGVVYFSGSGTTAGLAQAVIDGVRESHADPLDLPIVGSDIQDGRWANDDLAQQLDGAQGIVFGTPTYMGSVSGQMKAFLDAMAPRWYTQAWKDKVASGFTASSLPSGDKLSTFNALATFAMQMGMVWCGTGGTFADEVNANGFYFGAGATASTPEQLTEIDLATGVYLGRRVADLAGKLNST